MPTEDILDDIFRQLRNDFRAKAKRTFLEDIRGQIEEEQRIFDILMTHTNETRYVAVTVDRKLNDVNFSYIFFDVMLTVIDAFAKGNGILKPTNQLRVTRWHGSRLALLTVLRYFSKMNAEVRFQRALILPFPSPPVGHRLDPKIHMTLSGSS